MLGEAAGISTIRSGRDDPSVEKSTRLLEESGRERKIKTLMNTGRLCCSKMLNSSLSKSSD